jgi:hypothetical protein
MKVGDTVFEPGMPSGIITDIKGKYVYVKWSDQRHMYCYTKKFFLKDYITIRDHETGILTSYENGKVV